MTGRRQNDFLVETVTKDTDKCIDLHSWRGARTIHEIARTVEDPSVKFVDVYRDINFMFEMWKLAVSSGGLMR